MAKKDNWVHRAEGMRCSTCMWYASKTAKVNFGRCRRHAPTMSGFPAVFGSDWCGDHKLDETTLQAEPSDASESNERIVTGTKEP